MKKKNEVLENILIILSIILFFAVIFIICFALVKSFIWVITYKPEEIRKYEYVDLNDNKGMAEDCTRFRTYPSCYLEDGTVIAVKQYKEVWVKNER